MQQLANIEEDYRLGKLRTIENDLENFIRLNREKIRRFQEEHLRKLKTARPSDELAIKWYIMQIRTINPVDEIKTQLDEIEREIFYQAEKQGPGLDRGGIAKEWCRRHAPGWRDHRVLAIIFVLDRNKDHYIRIFNGQEP
ncbi:MAG: hypothetical protein HZA54_12065 [Planctomycetes bacterium]|nr:hypothetical protein [Planctomycetota bacterium]